MAPVRRKGKGLKVARSDRKGGNWEKVYALVKRIPRGRVVTYGQLARVLRLRGGARTAGYAISGCPSGRGIPWHRVVGAGGKILPREPYGSLQRRLLESEGARFSGMAVDLPAHQWRPPKSNAKPRSAPSRKKADSRK